MKCIINLSIPMVFEGLFGYHFVSWAATAFLALSTSVPWLVHSAEQVILVFIFVCHVTSKTIVSFIDFLNIPNSVCAQNLNFWGFVYQNGCRSSVGNIRVEWNWGVNFIDLRLTVIVGLVWLSGGYILTVSVFGHNVWVGLWKQVCSLAIIVSG